MGCKCLIWGNVDVWMRSSTIAINNNVLFIRTQCALLPLAVQISNFNELSPNCQTLCVKVSALQSCNSCRRPQWKTTYSKPSYGNTEIHSNRVLTYQSLVTVPSTVYKPGEFTKQVHQVSGKRRASWGHKYRTETGNNNEPESERCVKARDKNGAPVNDNTHL